MIVPLQNRVTIRVEEAEEKTKNGLYIPDKARVKTNKGIVVSIGPDVTTVAVGDTVLYDKFCGAQVQDTDETSLLVTREEDLIAKVI